MRNMSVLKITNLHVAVKDKEILKGVNLTLNEGETLALLGPNGHGKSTLLAAIMGNPNYTVTQGSITLDDKDILAMSVDQRSKAGIFLAMQYPSEIPGVNSADFLKAAMNAHREKPMSLFEFYNKLQKTYKEMGIPVRDEQPEFERRFLRGREETERDPSDETSRSEIRLA
jgi:Fe-S cluster assembly ATP-binding protein